MVRSACLFTVVLGVFQTAGVAVAQPPKPPRPKPVLVAERISKPVKFEYKETPLKEVIEDIKDLTGAPIVLDTRSLEEAAINLEMPVTAKSGGGSAFAEVNGLLKPLKLAAEIRNDLLFVSTAEKQASLLVFRAYRVSKAGEGGGLAKLISSKIAPDSWDQVGGSGSIRPFGASVLLVSQTPAIHREIERTHGRNLSAAMTPVEKPAALVLIKGVDPLAKMRPLLRRPVSAEYPETPLKEAVADFGKRYGMSVELDGAVLVTAGINLESPVTVNFKELPLDSVLTLTLQDLGLTWMVDGDKLLVTTPKAAEKRLISITYDVRDLTTGGNSDSLIDAITKTVHPASWQGVGGPGKISSDNGGLSIQQTFQVHRAIEAWLADVRTALRQIPANK